METEEEETYIELEESLAFGTTPRVWLNSGLTFGVRMPWMMLYAWWTVYAMEELMAFIQMLL